MDKAPESMRSLSHNANLTKQSGLGQDLRPAERSPACGALRSCTAVWRSKDAFFRRQKTISDLPIRPLIRYFDLELVCSRLECACDIELIGWRPYDSNRCSVHKHFRDITYLAEIEIDVLIGVKP